MRLERLKDATETSITVGGIPVENQTRDRPEAGVQISQPPHDALPQCPVT